MNLKRPKLTTALHSFALSGNGIVVGQPGVGKTFALHNFCDRLIRQNVPCVYLPIDKLGVETEAALKSELEIKGDFIEYLKNQLTVQNQSLGVLVIDAFDAARSEIGQKLYISLTRRVIKHLPGKWNVIISVRIYDARKSAELQDIFPASNVQPPLPEFQLEGIHCRHFALPKLNDREVVAISKTIPDLYALYNKGSREFKELLRIPFNLWLLEKLLTGQPKLSAVSSTTSEVELLGHFWRYRVTDGLLSEEKKIFLTKVTHAMVAQRSLSVRTDEVYVPGMTATWRSLLSSEILVNTSPTAQRVSFSHNILFDYAVSVLLVEDDPDKLATFVSQDPSRPLFLRPSLNFYFTRLWHDSRQLFWNAFWHMLPSSQLPVKLVFRILPPSVIVTEARHTDDLKPVFDRLNRNEPDAKTAVLRILQALRALRIERDVLWVAILEAVAPNTDSTFAWELASIASDILARSENKHEEDIIRTAGRIARRLFEWVSNERDKKKERWLDNFGASRVLPLVVKTFVTDPANSRQLLEKVLDLMKEPAFPIEFIYRLTDQIDKIWPYDPDFVAKIYLTVFGYSETSEERTHMGGVILPMSSTRQQDYHMCQYQLIEHFPNYLRDAPLLASRSAILFLNQFIVNRHVIPFLKEGFELKDLIETFPFRRRVASFIRDLSYIWDESEYPDEPLKLGQELYEFIDRLGSSSKKGLRLLDKLLDIFSENVEVAFFWRRLLFVGAKNPKVYSKRLFPLCVAPPIQENDETLRELGKFLEAASPEFSAKQMRQIETTILAIPNRESDPQHQRFLEKRRNRLLGLIPIACLQTQQAKILRHQIEVAGELPPNDPLVRFESSVEPYSEETWLREQGADLEQVENQKVRKLIEPLEKFNSEWTNKIPTVESINSILPVAKEAFTILLQESGAEQPVLDAAWTKLASYTAIMARGAANPEGPEFQFSREVMLVCAGHPLPEPDPEHDANYNFPFWSSAPRTEAALGIPWLALRKADDEVLKALETLAHDEKPSVRYLVTRELFRIRANAPDVFWRIAEDIAGIEQNHVVQQALCYSLQYTAAKEPDKTAHVLDKLVTKIFATNEDAHILESVVPLVMWLALERNHPWGINTAESFLNEPLSAPTRLKRAAFDALSFVTPQSVSITERSLVVTRAIEWLIKAINAAAEGIRELRTIAFEEWNESTGSN